MSLEDVKAYIPVIKTLIELHSESNAPVKSSEIAYRLGKSPGTIRGILNTLSKMGYVTGIPGPKGGYIPTMKAFLALKKHERGAPVRAIIDGETILLKVEGISIYTSASGEIIAEVKIEPPLPMEISTRKTIHLEAAYTPIGMFITGEIRAIDPGGKFEVSVKKAVAMPQITAEKIASTDMITAEPHESIREVAEKMAVNNIRAIPIIVDHDIRGMFSCQQLAEAVAAGEDLEKHVSDRMVDIPRISADASIRDVIRLMDATGIGRVLVIKEGSPIGILTRTDVLRFIVSQYADFEEREQRHT